MAVQSRAIPRAFIWKRIHSLMGFAIVVYLIEHLLTNAQAALWIGHDGKEFIKIVNLIHSLPFLKLIEITLIGVPIFFHAVLGIKYALTGKANSRKSDGTKPSLQEYGRNRAYTLQRLSSWVLLVGIILHVVQMRFLDYPEKVQVGSKSFYLTKIQMDEGLYTLAPRLNVNLYNESKIDQLRRSTPDMNKPEVLLNLESVGPIAFDESVFQQKLQKQSGYEKMRLVNTLSSYGLDKDSVVAICPDSGTAFLLNVRNTFKSFWMIGFYTLFVLAAGFHGFNGLWTFMISWGVILSNRSQNAMVHFCSGLMAIVIFLGLASVWGTYWINLRY